MAIPPPPYSDITGITRAVMKDNAQVDIADYNGNARPGEITINATNNDIYIGNATGALTRVIQATGNTVSIGNIRTVNNVTGFDALYIDPTTGEIVRYQP